MESFTAFIPINRCPLTCPWTPPVPSFIIIDAYCLKDNIALIGVYLLAYYNWPAMLPDIIASFLYVRYEKNSLCGCEKVSKNVKTSHCLEKMCAG